ncbi:hypothetical protein, partial [Arenibacter palladensis]|uniref:hypothetical protein n=1 Tax=Arenibacter palladensis TaxID=237373 RepID=UPI0026E2BEC8
ANPASDDQNIESLGLAGTTLTVGIEDGTAQTVDLAALLGTDDQTATEVTYDNTVSMLTATNTQAAIDELAATGGSDDQNIESLGLAGTTLTVGIEDGTAQTVDLVSLLGTDDQTATEVTYDNTASLLSATNTQAAIDELAATGGSDDQNIENLGLAGTTLTVGIEDGTAQTVDLATLLGTDDQTAAEVTYDNTTSLLTATDTQAAIDELAASGGSDDQNIENLGLAGTTLTVGIEDGIAQTVDLATLLGTDDQTAAEVTYDNTTSLLTATDTQAAIDELAAASGGENLSNTDLTQTSSEDRTYDLNGSDLLFRDNSGLPTTGNVGIGNLPGAPQSQLDVNGQIQARDGFAATEGTAGQPSYGFYTGGDTNTGMYRAAEDAIGFSVGGIEALHLEEAAGATNVVITESLQVDNLLLDKDGDSGTAGQVLSSTGTQTDWITPTAPSPFHAMGKINAGIPTNFLNVSSINTIGTGNYQVNFTSSASSSNYIIQLTLGVGSGKEIQVTAQNATNFSVLITNSSGTAVDSEWFFTVIDL